MRAQSFILPIVLGVSFSTFSPLVWAEETTQVRSSHHEAVAQIVKQGDSSQEGFAKTGKAGSAPAPQVPGSESEKLLIPEASSESVATTAPPSGDTTIREAPLKKTPALQILRDLQEGNKRFIEGVTKSGGKDSLRRKEVLGRQNPSAVVLSCSDSRVPPELIFDRGLDEIYTIRVAGNVLGAASVASIEYAIARLGVRLIVILGHESCEMVKAALSNAIGKTAGSPDLDTLISSIYTEENAGRSLASVDNDLVIRKSVIFNINGVADRLLKRSMIVRQYVQEGKVAIVRAIYGLESGKVDFWGLESLK